MQHFWKEGNAGLDGNTNGEVACLEKLQLVLGTNPTNDLSLVIWLTDHVAGVGAARGLSSLEGFPVPCTPRYNAHPRNPSSTPLQDVISQQP
jgi:hypothetical protein